MSAALYNVVSEKEAGLTSPGKPTQLYNFKTKVAGVKQQLVIYTRRELA